MSTPKHKVSYGGQAVIEGVMIKGQNSVSVAVRRSDGSIAFLRNPIHPFFKGLSKKIPLIRGIVTLAESLIVGMKSLVFSANVSIEHESDEISKSEMVGILSLSLIMAIGLFFILPVVASQPFEGLMGSDIASNIAEGVIRLAIFILYILLIGNMAQIHRVFMYHGAEHMTVHAYEHGDPLEKDFVRRYPTAHPRCGTAFYSKGSFLVANSLKDRTDSTNSSCKLRGNSIQWIPLSKSNRTNTFNTQSRPSIINNKATN